jgi:hypothetical protein
VTVALAAANDSYGNPVPWSVRRDFPAPRKEASMTRFLWICLAGAAGTGCRYLPLATT